VDYFAYEKNGCAKFFQGEAIDVETPPGHLPSLRTLALENSAMNQTKSQHHHCVQKSPLYTCQVSFRLLLDAHPLSDDANLGSHILQWTCCMHC